MKRFVAALYAFALAAALPMAAFASGENDGNGYSNTGAPTVPVAPETYNEYADLGVTTWSQTYQAMKVPGEADTFVFDFEANMPGYDSLTGLKVQGVEDLTVSTVDQYDLDQYAEMVGQEKLDEYMKDLEDMKATEGVELMGFLRIDAEMADDDAIVTFYTDRNAGDIVRVMILHSDGTITYENYEVDAQGMISFTVDGFSLFALFDVTEAPQVWRSNYVAATSPKTGC